MLTLTITKTIRLDFDDWQIYSKTKATDYNDENDYLRALKNEWNALLEETDGSVDCEYDITEDEITEMLDEYNTSDDVDKSDPKLIDAIDNVFEKLTAMGIRCEKDFECCQTCASSALKDCENYAYYHSQDNDDIIAGGKAVHVGFKLTKEKFFELTDAKIEHLVVPPTPMTRLVITPYDDVKIETIKNNEEHTLRRILVRSGNKDVNKIMELVDELTCYYNSNHKLDFPSKLKYVLTKYEDGDDDVVPLCIAHQMCEGDARTCECA